MATIGKASLDPAAPVARLWADVAEQTNAWLQRQGLPVRDAIVLLPFAALLAPARAAFAARPGWQPRVETVLTLVASLGPPSDPEPGLVAGDPMLDRLTAAAWLRRQAWAAAWERQDAAAFAASVAQVADTAVALREGALARPPAARAAYWDAVRDNAAMATGPAATEALLLRVAIEWAAASDSAHTDTLFALRPSAWIALRLGGCDPLAEALLCHAGVPSLHLHADAPDEAPFAAIAASAQAEMVLCDDFESEAQAAAATVIDALNAGQAPVALVAIDREGVRRVRALLERAQVPLVDETGWRLSTTRAAASVVALLRAALPGAGPDTRLEWLKTWPGADAPALDALEAVWRQRRHVPGREAADRLWASAQAHLRPLAMAGGRPLVSWLELLHERLAGDGSLDRLAADAAGQQVLAALGGLSGMPWQPASAEVRLELPGFIAWVESTLELAPFLPPPDAGAQVVLTPLSRAFGRPFGRVVVPGADQVRLGSVDAPPSLMGDRMAAALGLSHAAERRQRQRLALAQVLRADRVTLLRRRRDGDEPVAESPDVEWLLLERARAGLPAWTRRDWQPPLTGVQRRAVQRPQPVAATALPVTLSASTVEALRQCPYRFFARAVLRLDEPEELDAALAKREYGNWLHAVLHRFHVEFDAGADRLVQLQAAAEWATGDLGLDAGELLPYRASFETFAPAYLKWLSAREGQGWQWLDGEFERRLETPWLIGVTLRGRIDRLDLGPDGTREVIDYKTGSAEQLKRRVKDPLEDTQLAFYAALLGVDTPVAAAYLALDDAEAPVEIVHPEVQKTALALLDGLADEWPRLQAGAAMPALGEGTVCETCEARGLCRRDHWAAS